MRILAVLCFLAACTDVYPEATPAAPALQTSGVSAPGVSIGADALTIGRIDFGLIAVGAQAAGTATITNNSPSPIETGAVMIDDPTFEVVATSCARSIAPGASCEVTVSFTPDAIGPFDATLAIAPEGHVASGRLSGAGGGVVNLTVAGAGRIGAERVTCADSCASVIGAQVTLHAAPARGAHFVMWMGACAGAGDCTVTPDAAAQQVRAVFTPITS
jgi:hypothetical protein